MAEKKAVATDTMPADANADAVNNADVANNADAVANDTTATSTDAVSNADATNNDEATNTDTAEAPKNDTTTEKASKGDTSAMVVYTVDSTAVRIGDEYFYSSDWTITIPARLVEEAEKMGFVRVENA